MLDVVSFEQCPAKAYKDGDIVRFGHNVADHCFIVGSVAKALIERIPFKIKNNLIPNGSELIAACHDVGKVSPTFYLKLKEVVGGNYSDLELDLKRYFTNPSEIDLSFGGHSSISAAEFLDVRNHMAALITGSHHGTFFNNIYEYEADCDYFGGVRWHKERVKLIQFLKERLGVEFPNISPRNIASLRVLCGLTTVSDWVGSGGCFNKPKDDWLLTLDSDIQKTLDDAGFFKLNIKKSLGFNELFGFNTPNELQLKSETALTAGCVMVIEAPMGIGKTETALNLAYKSLVEFDATGVYFALPTQLTSDKIYDRFNAYLENILEDKQKAKLLHSQAWLLKTKLGEDGVAGRDWFDQGKRGLLAPFAVGTIDQALMSVIQVKHNFVRSFGLMGKVVILDEVHSYDVYTGFLLDELIKHLVSLKCTVIILSATLNRKRKGQLLGLSDSSEMGDSVYPCITKYDYNTKKMDVIPLTVSDEKNIKIIQSNTNDAYSEAIYRAQQGQYVLWIENTVDSSIEAFNVLSTRLAGSDVECGLIHSRFTTSHRAEKEDYWVSLFGKSNKNRVKGKILVGTQILEQSLDIDADFLVSRFAPTDFIFQRLGRLWRHSRDNRNVNAVCEAWLLAPNLDSAVSNSEEFGATAFIYSEYVLLKSLNSWQHIFEQKHISIPKDISPLIEATYSEEQDEFELLVKEHKRKLMDGDGKQKGLKALRSSANRALARVGAPPCNERVATRFIEVQSKNLYLFKGIKILPDCIEFVFIDGQVMQFDGCCDLAKLLIELRKQVVKCPAYKLNDDVVPFNQKNSPTLLKALYQNLHDDAACFALILDNHVVQDFLGLGLSSKQIVSYREDIGLVFNK